MLCTNLLRDMYPFLSFMLFIPSLYYPFLNLKNFSSPTFLCMHACMNLVCLLFLITNIIDEVELCYSLIS